MSSRHSATGVSELFRSSRARRRGDAGRHRELSGLGCCWRQRDVDVMSSPEFRQASGR